MTVLNFDPGRDTNAKAILDLAALGILRFSDSVLDLTIGPAAGFWTKWRPDQLVTNDIDLEVVADHHWDGTDVPAPANSFDVVVWDPPYANRGTSRHPMDKRFGLGEYKSPEDVEARLVAGTVEALRLARRLVLVKCQDACVASRYQPQTFAVWEAATEVGGRIVGEMYVTGRVAQPAGKQQRNIWSNCSTLMLFDARAVRQLDLFAEESA